MEKLYWSDVYFNSHPHEEDDRKSTSTRQSSMHFNSHPHEEDDATFLRVLSNINISTHILTKRMTQQQRPLPQAYMHFNSHPHEEDDFQLVCFLPLSLDISTHILTKRMTNICYLSTLYSSISTHILTKRMT